MSSAAAPEPAAPLPERAFLPPAAKHLAVSLEQLQATARSVEGALSACCCGDSEKALVLQSAAARSFERAHAAFRLAVVESAAEEPQVCQEGMQRLWMAASSQLRALVRGPPHARHGAGQWTVLLAAHPPIHSPPLPALCRPRLPPCLPSPPQVLQALSP